MNINLSNSLVYYQISEKLMSFLSDTVVLTLALNIAFGSKHHYYRLTELVATLQTFGLK